MNKTVLKTVLVAVMFLISLIAVVPIKSGQASINTVYAASYTAEQLATHRTTSDCWVSFENKVYDITNCVVMHYEFMNISSWCGKDMTTAFTTKNGSGVDHRQSTYRMLESYYLGNLVTAAPPVDTTPIDTDTGTTADSTVDTGTDAGAGAETTSTPKPKNPYNFVLPFSIAFGVFLISCGLVESKKIALPLFNMFWNTVLILSAFPSVIFGFYMIASYSFPALRNVNFDFLYWHVEGSTVFGTIVIMHLLRRLRMYVAPLQILKKRPPVTQPVQPIPPFSPIQTASNTLQPSPIQRPKDYSR